MPPTVSWPTRPPSYVTTNGSSAPVPGLPAQVRAPCAAKVGGGVGVAPAGRGLPRPQPGGVAARAPRARPRGRAAGAAAARRRPSRSVDRPAAVIAAPLGVGSVVAPGDLLDRVHAAAGRARRGRPAPRRGEPGRLTTSVRPATPGEPAGQRRGRHALARRRTPGSPRRCPGTSRSSTAPGHLGGAVGRREPGAAGGEHDVVRRRRPRRAAPPRPARRRARRPGPSTSKPSAAQRLDEQRARRGPRRRRPPRGSSTVTTRARITAAHSPAPVARTCRRSSPRPARR